MANAIQQFQNNLKAALLGLGHHSAGIGSVAQQVHDGDTLVTRTRDTAMVPTPDNLNVRFLGVDAAEVSLEAPKEANAPQPANAQPHFVAITNPLWETFLQDPFDARWAPFTKDGQVVALDPLLAADLASRLQAGTTAPAANHAFHADKAQRALEKKITDDITKQALTKETFQFFMVFGYEVMDRYGRLLGYISVNHPTNTPADPRPLSYNEQLLEEGLVTPYFIWPNVDPFLTQGGVVQAVIPPNTANVFASRPGKLRDARRWVNDARTNHIGVFDPLNPLRLLSFELRYLSQRRPPDRWVIDMGVNDDRLIPPEQYYTVANIEDRLFIPSEYVPLFHENGWKYPGE